MIQSCNGEIDMLKSIIAFAIVWITSLIAWLTVAEEFKHKAGVMFIILCVLALVLFSAIYIYEKRTIRRIVATEALNEGMTNESETGREEQKTGKEG